MDDEFEIYKETLRRLWLRYKLAVDRGDYAAAHYTATRIERILDIESSDYGEF